MPVEPRLRLGTRRPQIHAGEHPHPAEMRRRFLGRDRSDRHVQAFAEDLGDGADRNTFLGDRIVARAFLAFLQGKPVEPRHVGDMRGWEAVLARADIGREAFFARDRDQRRDPTLSA